MDDNMTLRDNKKREYSFKLELGDNSIFFWLKEKNVYAPFTFENSFTLEEIREHHKIFKACYDLEEVFNHFDELYKNKRIKLIDTEDNGKLSIIFSVGFISLDKEETREFELERVMTKDKDEDLLKLYEIEKEQILKLKKIKKIINEKIAREHPLYKEIIRQLEDCEFKLD